LKTKINNTMKTKIYLILLIFFGLVKTFAQSYEEQYLLEEQSRLDQVKIIENEIQTFTNQNINTYNFTEVINNVNNMKYEDGNSLSGNFYQEALLQAKEQKLRDVFFQQNPEKLKYFYAAPLKQQCVNGGFESNGGSTSGYSFAYYNYPDWAWSSFANAPFLNAPPINIPHQYANLVNSSTNDPNITSIPRVFSGTSAIRLNQSQLNVYSRSVTSMRRTFTVNEDFISFAYALFFQNPSDGGHPEDTRYPYYQVRLLTQNPNTSVLFERHMDTSSSGFIYSPSNNILYTGWKCEKINTSAFIGQVVTLEITMSNCGSSGHIGYGYFDDFCGISNCESPTINPSITLNPIRRGCPTFPLPITGNITLPPNSSFTNVTLQVVDNSNNVINSKIITSAPGGFFSTDLQYNDFYPNGYSPTTDFNIWAFLNYSINGTPQQSVFTSNTNPPGPDISFKNCSLPCQEEWLFTTNQPIQTSTNFQASCCITAESAIYPNVDVEFKAGYEIILKPAQNGTAGFYATSHHSGNFHAYIGRCDESSIFSKVQSKQAKIITEKNISDLNLKISPNPASTFINIDSGNEKITSWELFDISGKNVLKGNSTQVNVQGLPKAAYLLKININNKITTKKVIVK
jgi:hypothetical protein